mgnify:CR=1 FL=1
MARNQVRPNSGQQLKVVQPSLHDSLLLQQHELQAQRKLSINKPINQIPKQKQKTKPKVTTNHLQAPYKKPIAKTAAKPTVKTTAKPQSRTLTFGDTTIELPRDLHKLEQMKEEALEYWRTLPEIT